MSRTIKFRAWDEKYKYMNYKVCVGNDDLQDENYTCHSMYVTPDKVDYKCEPHWMGFEVDNGYQLMQYTGLKDRNGVEIYEFDFVRSNGSVYLIKLHQSTMLALYSPDNINSPASYPVYKDDQKGFEVIGNIYENPELLTK